MRLWHIDLIPALPDKQLRGQWRECCLIAKAISEKGTPNHLLVNKVMDYPIEHFINYTAAVCHEMFQRGYITEFSRFCQWIPFSWEWLDVANISEVFPCWHNDRYFAQCYYNLEEKYDCGGISEEEFEKIRKRAIWKGMI